MHPKNLSLKKFDPFQMPAETVRYLAIGREALLQRMLSTARENLDSPDPPQHLALLAPRGHGKTFLLRLLGLEIDALAAADEKFHFLHMPEEMPDIFSPPALLREILRMLRRQNAAANISPKHDDPHAWPHLVVDIDSWLDEKFGPGQGLLVLCLENIDSLLADAFPDEPQRRALRNWLDRPGARIMLVAASSTGAFDQDSARALFRVTQIINMPAWTTEETLQFLNRVLSARAGRALTDTESRIARAITLFTGGSPRMAVALADTLGAEDALHAAGTLNNLIDDLHDYYHARLRDLGADARRCIGALLRARENISQTELAESLGIPQSAISQTFRSLQQRNVIVGETVEGAKEGSYRLADRVFVHWYRVRFLEHASDRSVLAPLLDFLVSAYTEPERAAQATRFFARGLHDDAMVLVKSLPVLDELTADHHWWTSARGWTDHAFQLLKTDPTTPQNARAAIENLLQDRTNAEVLACSLAGQAAGDIYGFYRVAESACWIAAGNLTLAANAAVEAAQHENQIVSELGRLFQMHATLLRGDLKECAQFAQAAYDKGRRRTSPRLANWACTHLAFVAGQRGETAQQAKWLKTYRDLAARAGEPIWMSRALIRTARFLSGNGDLVSAREYADNALKYALDSNDAAQIAAANSSIAYIALFQGDFQASQKFASEAAGRSHASGDLEQELAAREVMADALAGQLKLASAADALRQGVRSAISVNSEYLRARAYVSLAYHLSIRWAGSAEQLVEAKELAEKALGILNENPHLANYRRIALEVRLRVAARRPDLDERLGAARAYLSFLNGLQNTHDVAWPQQVIVDSLQRLACHEECITEATRFLRDMPRLTISDITNLTSTARSLIASLTALGRFDELPSIIGDLEYSMQIQNNPAAAAGLNSVLLTAALTNAKYAWATERALELLAQVAAAADIKPTWPNRIEMALTAIAVTKSWSRAANILTPSLLQTAADQGAGNNIAEIMRRIEESSGRPDSYAIFRALWDYLRPQLANESPTQDAARAIINQVTTSHHIKTMSHGLLNDMAGTLEAEATGQFDPEIRMLREFARFNESGRDPKMLARLDPDVATALRATNPDLAAAQPAEKRLRKRPAVRRPSRAKKTNR